MRSSVPPIAVAAAAILGIGVVLGSSRQQPKAAPTSPRSAPAVGLQRQAAVPQQPPPSVVPNPGFRIPTHPVEGGICPGVRTLAPLRRILDLPCETEIHPTCAREYNGVLASARVLPNRLVHDCQKLITPAHTYGPLAALLPAPLNSRLKQMIGPVPGRTPRPPVGPISFALADILVYDGMEYPQLNLKPGLNCLRVRGELGDPHSWVAEIGTAKSCATNEALGEPRTMAMRVLPYSELKDFTNLAQAVAALDTLRHPDTGRWGWDDTIQFIGTHCGIAWCEFGPKGFKGSGKKVGDGIGMGDAQFLATVDSATGRLEPSYVWGSIEPDPGLAGYDDNDLTHGPRVAYVVLSEVAEGDVKTKGAPPTGAGANGRYSKPHDDYNKRYKLRDLIKPLVSFTDVYMQRVGNNYSVATRPNVTHWTPTVRCPWRHAAVGSVRWRWDSKDEDIWAACSQGCCTATQLQE